MKRLAVVIALCLVPLPSFAADKIPVSMVVVCADKSVGDKFTRATTSQFKTYADYELTDKLPRATLFVYVNQDVEDRKNPNGWSIAIAHVNNQTIQAVAARLINGTDDAAKALKPTLITLINEPGQLAHLSVAHIDEMSDANVTKVVDSIVTTFFEKISQYLRR